MRPTRVLAAVPAGPGPHDVLGALSACGLDLEVIQRTGGTEALETLLLGGFDCAVVAAGLPGLGGVELLRELQRAGNPVPVIVVADPAEGTDGPEALRAGAHDFVAADAPSPARLASAVVSAARVAQAERRAAAAEARHAHQLLYDSGTGLPGRALFFDRLGQTLAAARRARTDAAVALLRLDGIAALRADYGESAADGAMRRLASRLRSAARGSDTLARLGAGTFALVPGPGCGLAGARSAAAKILDAARRPLPVGGPQLALGAAAGIALSRTTARTA